MPRSSSTMRVARRLMKARSWLTNSSAPANSSRNCSSHSIASISRWLVGSSSNRMSGSRYQRPGQQRPPAPAAGQFIEPGRRIELQARDTLATRRSSCQPSAASSAWCSWSSRRRCAGGVQALRCQNLVLRQRRALLRQSAGDDLRHALTGERGDVLRQMGHPGARPDPKAAGIGLGLAAHQPQQRGLALAVASRPGRRARLHPAAARPDRAAAASRRRGTPYLDEAARDAPITDGTRAAADIIPAAMEGSAMASKEVWSPTQRHIVVASFLGWMLDAFDFFLVVFVLKRLAGDFGTDVKSVTYAIFLTLAMRPVGRFPVRPAGRSLRAPAGADGQRAAVLGHGVRVRIRAVTAGVPGAARAVRHRHGRRVGRRRLAGVREHTGQVARPGLGDAAGRLPVRLSAGLDRVRAAVRSHRLARHVHGGRRAGAAGAVYPQQGARVGGLDGNPQPRRQPRACGMRSLVIGCWRCMRSR